MDENTDQPPHLLSPKVHWSRACGYFELEMFAEASRELSALPEELPWSKYARSMLADVACLQEEWERMRELAHGLRMEFPTEPEWWISDAYATRRCRSIEIARQILLEGLVHHYDNALIRYNLACYACRMGSLGECLDFLKEAVKRDKRYRAMAMEDEDLEEVREALLQLGWGDSIA